MCQLLLIGKMLFAKANNVEAPKRCLHVTESIADSSVLVSGKGTRHGNTRHGEMTTER